MSIDAPALHERLREAHGALSHQRITGLFDTDSDRHERYQCHSNGLVVDFSKHLLDDHVWQLLVELASVHALPEAFAALVAGHQCQYLGAAASAAYPVARHSRRAAPRAHRGHS